MNIVQLRRGDRGIWAVMGILAVASVLAVYSSTSSLAFGRGGGDTEYYLLKHTIFLVMSIGAAWLASMVPFKKYLRYAPILWLLSVVLLLATMLFGLEINEARRWLQLPIIGMSFQPSEFAKIALILYVAAQIASRQEAIKGFREAFLPLLVPIIVVVGLIAPSDLSTAALLFGVCLIMLFIGRVDWKYIALLIGAAVMFLLILLALESVFPDLLRVDTWKSRIEEFLYQPEGGYQVQQAKMAIARGYIFGEGPGSSIQRNFLPYPYADFIFAIIAEEYGLMGAAFIIMVYLFLLWRVVVIATRSTSVFAAMVTVGLGLNIVVQAFMNIAVSVQLVPVTGLTLPLISMGGSSVLITSIAIGILLSASHWVNTEFKKRLQRDAHTH